MELIWSSELWLGEQHMGIGGWWMTTTTTTTGLTFNGRFVTTLSVGIEFYAPSVAVVAVVERRRD